MATPKFTQRTPEQQALLVRVAKAALATPKSLDMGNWHTCETTHCIAGWAAYLTNPENPFAALAPGEWYDDAGRRLLGEEAADKFYKDNIPARRWLKKVLREAGELPAPGEEEAK